MESSLHYEAIIVGGGPAGLSAALFLGRCRRRVLVCDAGHPRNERSRAMHGFLSRDGMSPVEFGRVCREQLSHYPNIEFRPGEIVRAERHDDQLEVIHSDGAVHYVKTCVPGVFAAGNASTGLQLVIIAAAEGTRAAFAINEMLVEKERRVRP